MTRKSKEIVDNLLEPMYDNNIASMGTYEKDIIEIMIDLNCSLSEALYIDFDMNLIDKESVIDIVDYLEYRLAGDLNKVNMLMQVYTGMSPDLGLIKL